MPIEVRELIIRATVSQESSGAKKSAGKDDKSQNEEIVKQCVAKVMEIIRSKNGR
jgi:hypothetical protein